MKLETWYCKTCGSLAIMHEAVAVFNPQTQAYEVSAVLDATWCEDCARLAVAGATFDAGDPEFGTPPDRYKAESYVCYNGAEGESGWCVKDGDDTVIDFPNDDGTKARAHAAKLNNPEASGEEA